jgi:hypothetical protein
VFAGYLGHGDFIIREDKLVVIDIRRGSPYGVVRSPRRFVIVTSAMTSQQAGRSVADVARDMAASPAAEEAAAGLDVPLEVWLMPVVSFTWEWLITSGEASA